MSCHLAHTYRQTEVSAAAMKHPVGINRKQASINQSITKISLQKVAQCTKKLQ